MFSRKPQPESHLFAEIIEAEAYSDFCLAIPGPVRVNLGFQEYRTGSVLTAVAGLLDVAAFNRTLGLGVVEPATERQVADIIGCYVAAGVKNFLVHAHPGALPQWLPSWLFDNGLDMRSRWAKMTRDDEPIKPAKFDGTVHEATAGDTGDFARLAAAAHGIPSTAEPWFGALIGREFWHCYVAKYQGEGIATACMYRAPTGMAWLGFAATLPAHRKHGAHHALVHRRVADALTAGATQLVTEADENSVEAKNLTDCGFQLAYLRANFGRG